MTHDPANLLDDLQAAVRAIARVCGDLYERRGELATADRSAARPAKRDEAQEPTEGRKR